LFKAHRRCTAQRAVDAPRWMVLWYSLEIALPLVETSERFKSVERGRPRLNHSFRFQHFAGFVLATVLVGALTLLSVFGTNDTSLQGAIADLAGDHARRIEEVTAGKVPLGDQAYQLPLDRRRVSPCFWRNALPVRHLHPVGPLMLGPQCGPRRRSALHPHET